MAQITTDKTTERVGRTVNGSTKKYADEKARAELNKIFTDMAYAGSGIGTCTTAATTAAKTAVLSNYLMLKNMPVSVFFQNGVNVANATLNINSQGAKPIFIGGSALQPGVIRPRTTVTFVYDGTNYNIICIGGLEQSDTPDALYVDMGLPSGLKWAKRNIDITQANGFAASEFQYECSFFSWGNTEGHNPADTSSFSYNWGGINESDPPYEGQVYGSTPGNALTGNIAPSQDAARVNLGAPWRMPTTEEYAELFANIDYIDGNGDVIDSAQANKLVTIEGITGIRIKSKVNGNSLFFPCSGYGAGTSWYTRGGYGLYWSASFHSARSARGLHFLSGGVYPQNVSNRYYGFAVRPVQ